MARLKRLLKARRPARREYEDLEVEHRPPGCPVHADGDELATCTCDLEEELDDFDEDELGIDPEEGL